MMGENPNRPSQEDSILLLDWLSTRRHVYSDSLRHEGLTIISVEAIHQVAGRDPALIVIPAAWPDQGGDGKANADLGLAVLSRLRHLHPYSEIIVFRNPVELFSTLDRCRFLAEGASCFVDSDLIQEIFSHIQGCLKSQHYQPSSEGGLHPKWFQALGIVGNSPAFNKALWDIQKAAQFHDVTVLITGASGTGKQLLAEALHQLDRKRCNHPFITVNCGSISATLVESELFGHRRGAFTDATKDREGAFRAAHGGTLFLDEIGEMDLSLQPKLLRVLESKCVRTLGEDHEIPIDVRIIAATNRDLGALVGAGEFRLDLHQRLGVFEIELPPLTQRLGDLRPLTDFFVKKHHRFYSAQIEGIDPEVIEVFSRLLWPGNIRQLENLIRRILLDKQHGHDIQLEDLPMTILQEVTGGPPTRDDNLLSNQLLSLVTQKRYSLEAALRYCERLLLKGALIQSAGNRSVVARQLKIPKTSLFRKSRHYGLGRVERLVDK